MSADEIRVEAVARAKRPGMVRHWRGEELVAATCRDCGELTPAEELVTSRKKPGGKALLCRACGRDAITGYRASEGPEKTREKSRDYTRRWIAKNPEKVRENNRRAVAEGRTAKYTRAAAARRRARTPEEIAAKRAELRPDGVKKCRGCRHWLQLSSFYDDTSRADGLSPRCRSCDLAAVLARRYGTFLDSWEDRDLWRDAYTGEAYAEIEHTIPKTAFEADDADPDDPRNLSPASVWTNRGAGGKHTKDPLDFVEELYPGLLDKLAHWPAVEVTLRPRAAA